MTDTAAPTAPTPADFAITALNKVRKANRGHYDRETVFGIIDAALVAHVGFVDRGRPVVMPMLCARIGGTLYLHGAKATRFFKRIGDRVPVCITVTHVDGLVVARCAFNHSINYRSAIVHGTARRITDPAELDAALVAVTDHLLPGRWDEVRPMTDKERAATGVLAVDIEAASAKIRTGPPIDDDPDYAEPVWGGVVPVTTALARPVPDGRGVAGVPVPASIDRAAVKLR